MIKMRNGAPDDGSSFSMPSLSHVGNPMGQFENIQLAQEYATAVGTTRNNLPRKSNHSIHANMTTAGSRSVNPRSVAGRYKMTLV